ncbi:hypothetical protein JYK04_00051 [Streptomyces nojiriensis]|nr:hypothetical protein JYK04_00051 [Streptomyces nojiriensis]
MRAIACDASAIFSWAVSPLWAMASATQDWRWSSIIVRVKDCSALVVALTWARTSMQ